MNKNDPGTLLDLTVGGVEFARWSTVIENDDLELGNLTYSAMNERSYIQVIQEKREYRLPRECRLPQACDLVATFLSLSKSQIFSIYFDRIIAFRVLDESGLCGLWAASGKKSRPGSATFRARGHEWAAESPLIFLNNSVELHFSYFVATETDCLEVICHQEPIVALVAEAIVTSIE